MSSFGLLPIVLLISSVDAIFLFSLPRNEVDLIHANLSVREPSLMKSPNDVDQIASIDLEKDHHYIVESAQNLVDLAKSLNLTVLVSALEETGLDNIIDHEGKFTIFAPTDEAFHNVPEWAGKISMKDLLRFHVARGLIYAEDIRNEMLVRSLLSKRDIRFNIYKNGTLTTANGSPVVAVNYTAHNGVLHIISTVMVSLYGKEGTIGKEIASCPNFKILTKMIAVAELQGTLHGRGPFTLFAPTDTALEALPADVVDHLIHNPSALREVLLYHVAVGTHYSAGFENGTSLKTAQGARLEISFANGVFVVNKNAPVTRADSTASNGVIHAIGNVLIPPEIKQLIGKQMSQAKRPLVRKLARWSTPVY